MENGVHSIPVIGPGRRSGSGPDARGAEPTGPVGPSGPETEFRILGPVEVHDARTGLKVLPTGAKQRALLGALVVRAGQTVSAHRLIDEVWGGHPPANAGNALQAHVARLRRLLARPHSGSPEPHREWIATRPFGYVLRLDGTTTDAERFNRLAAEGRAVAVGDPGRAADLLRHALALWRGPALEGSVRGAICAAEAAQLEETRLTALEALYDACLRASRHDEITGELEELTADHPVRERFYDLLMVALYRCGRQAEALGVYDRARQHLVRELGVEPGPALRDRMEAVLNHDPALAAPGPAGPLPAALPRIPPSTVVPAVPDAPGGEASVTSLTHEIARLRSHVERLFLEHEALIRRFDSLQVASLRAR
ncbi:AfsR/SARP family transcriptional regulator [Streptomyces solaniscabiei]|uniref:AfsR/SARP family transcriptional regulator n=1 Tax=Streptomyces solaniscabiei TaxID=2683255 RepID=UPI001CE2E041|nr:AfsR/SARP family transcriptional regulator [Streptomyces solaniscabiei]